MNDAIEHWKYNSDNLLTIYKKTWENSLPSGEMRTFAVETTFEYNSDRLPTKEVTKSYCKRERYLAKNNSYREY